MAAVISTEIMEILSVIVVIGVAITVEFNTTGFDCRIGTTPEVCDNVSNCSGMGSFSKQKTGGCH